MSATISARVSVSPSYFSLNSPSVHCAFAHGNDDYAVASAIGMDVECYVDEKGVYTRAMGPFLYGKSVLDQATVDVIKREVQ